MDRAPIRSKYFSTIWKSKRKDQALICSHMQRRSFVEIIKGFSNFFFNLNIPINCSPNELQNMTTNGQHAISPEKKLNVFPIPNTIKQKANAPTIKAVFLSLNRSLNLSSLDKFFFFL